MATIKGILSFNTLFQPKPVRDAQGNPTGDAKYSLTLLIPPNDPQLPELQAEVEAAKANTFPSGFPSKADICFLAYDTKFQGKDYYNPQLSGYYTFSCTAKAEDKPAIVDMSHQPIIDPGAVVPGMVVWVNAGISGYTKGTGGVGGWLNGVMLTGEMSELGRLDNKPSVEQMFANVNTPAPASTPPNAIITPQPAATPMAPPQASQPPAAPPSAPQYQMTPAANGTTREAYHKAGWTDEQLISHGLMLPPGGVMPSFVG